MSGKVRVEETETVYIGTKGILVSFHTQLPEIVRKIESKITVVISLLEEKEHGWEHKLDNLTQELHGAKQALYDCEASAYTDDDGYYVEPDCSNESHCVDELEYACSNARGVLTQIRSLLSETENRKGEFRRQTANMEYRLLNIHSTAISKLNKLFDHLETYIFSSEISSYSSEESCQKPETIGKSNTSGAAKTPGAGGSNETLRHNEKMLTSKLYFKSIPQLPQALPPSRFGGEWKIIKLENIDMRDGHHIQGPSDFRKVSLEDMKRGWALLYKRILPDLNSGKVREDFATLDNKLGLQHKDGLLRIYEAFFGDEPIRLSKVGETYQVTNGYHRLFAAKEMQLDYVVASVATEKTKVRDD